MLRQALKLKQIELTIMSSINLPAEQYSITISDTQIRCELVCCFFFQLDHGLLKYASHLIEPTQKLNILYENQKYKKSIMSINFINT